MLVPIFLIFLLFVRTEGLFGDRLLPKDRKNPPSGPCTLNDDGLKCNEHGYYETVQCDKETCYCVTPHTALVAFDTRTENPRTAPKCGACFVYLQKLFANGDPPENSFIPKCDVGKGNFEPVQCETKSNKCYCVEPTTGKELPGTRTVMSNTSSKSLNCMKIDFSIDAFHFPTFEKPDAQKLKDIIPVGRPYCLKNKDAGHTCSQNKTSIKYYFDAKYFKCFPFEYKGCGGNENLYHTSGACYSDCVMMDYFSCPMQSQPARRSDGNAYTCGTNPPPPPGYTTTTTPGPKLDTDGCPAGYSCTMGPFFGFCCDIKLTKRYNEAYKPVCRNGKAAHFVDEDGWKDVTLGRDCRDNFCPKTHNCETNEFFAFCCPKY